MDDLDLYFEYKCRKGLAERGLAGLPEYEERLKFEMGIIIKMKFPGYFLVVADKVNWAKRNNIFVGPGRGSAAGALVTYCLKITDLDPLKYGLLFERFINPERVSLPDIDMDYGKEDRTKVIEYVVQKYGKDHVAHIATFGYLKAKSAVKSITRVLGQPYEVGDKLSKLLLNPIHGKYQSITESIKQVPELAVYVRAKGIEADILGKALQVEGSINSVGVHAAGVVISTDSLFGKIPVFLGKGDEVTTQWDMKNVEQAGLIKFDFLGLDTLDRIKLCLELIKTVQGKTVDIVNIPVDDEKVYENLRSGDTCAIFQLEASTGIKDLLVQIRPKVLEDIIVLVAMYRPGPLASKEFQSYLKVRAGEEKAKYLIPELRTILGPTDGLMVYQEQVLRIATDLAGYTMGQADLLRRAIGKKIDAEMQAQYSKFLGGWVANGYPEDKGQLLWNDILAFADYAFNKSHSACYGFITYQTAWLKAHYPVEWMTAVLTCEGNVDQTIKYIAECKKMGIKVLPPDINRSEKNFSIDEDGNIRFGLAPVKNLGQGPVEEIIQERANGRFDSLLDFTSRVDLSVVNRLKLESLIKAGAFDNGTHSRAAMLATVLDIWRYRDEFKSYTSKQATFEKKSREVKERITQILAGTMSETGKPLKPLKDPVKPELPAPVVVPALEEYPMQELLEYEHELLGYYVSAHPMDEMKYTIIKENLSKIDQIKELPNKSKVRFGAMVTGISEITTAKAKQKMAYLVLEDTTGQIDGVVFAKMYDKFKDLIALKVPLKLEGTIDVTESEDERTTKVSIFNVSVLEKKEVKRKEVTDLSVHTSKIGKFIDSASLGTHSGLRLTFDFEDGTSVKCLDTVYIDKSIRDI